MKKSLLILGAGCYIGLCGCLSAAETIPADPVVPSVSTNGAFTWQQVIRVAMASNVNYAALMHDARAEYFRVRAKADWQNPQLLLSTSLPNEHPVGKAEDDRQYGLRMRFYIPNPFVNGQLHEVAKATRRTLEEEARIERSEAALVIYQLCAELQMAQALLDLHTRRSELFTVREQYLLDSLKNRLIPEYEFQAQQIQVMRHDMTVEQVKQSIQTARRALSILTRIPADMIQLPPLSRALAVVASGLAQQRQIVAMSPEYRAAIEATHKIQAEHKAAKASNIPWFDYVDTGYEFNDSRDEGQWQLRVAFILPVFSTSLENAAHAARAAANLREADVEQQLKARYEALQLELRDAWAVVDRLPKVPVPMKDAVADPARYYKMCEDCFALEEQQLELLYRPLVVCGELFQVLNLWESVKD
jgi:hypothetical protein